MTKTYRILLVIGLITSCFGAANSFTAYHTYTVEKTISEIHVPSSFSNEGLSGELKYCSEIAVAVQEKLILSLERFKWYAFIEALMWLFLFICISVSLLVERLSLRQENQTG